MNARILEAWIQKETMICKISVISNCTEKMLVWLKPMQWSLASLQRKVPLTPFQIPPCFSTAVSSARNKRGIHSPPPAQAWDRLERGTTLWRAWVKLSSRYDVSPCSWMHGSCRCRHKSRCGRGRGSGAFTPKCGAVNSWWLLGAGTSLI